MAELELPIWPNCQFTLVGSLADSGPFARGGRAFTLTGKKLQSNLSNLVKELQSSPGDLRAAPVPSGPVPGVGQSFALALARFLPGLVFLFCLVVPVVDSSSFYLFREV